MFEVTMLAAGEGDALVLRYGPNDAPRQVLIDAGRASAYGRLLDFLPEGSRSFELFVVTHVDRDHIEGALKVLGDAGNGFAFGDVWFNAYRHLEWDDEEESFGAEQGEDLTTLIGSRRLPWNLAFGGGPVRLDGEAPVTRVLPGGMTITLLSPDARRLKALKPGWERECRRAGIVPSAGAEGAPQKEDDDADEAFGGSLRDLAETRTREDAAAPNGTSIAFLAEYDGRRVLFASDAHPALLCRSLDLLGVPLPLRCDAMKVPHHGSRANVTRDLLDRLDCRRFLVSTSGSYFCHPDDVAIARIVTTPGEGDATLYFNYRSDYTRPWDEGEDDKREYGFRCVYPARNGDPLTIGL